MPRAREHTSRRGPLSPACLQEGKSRILIDRSLADVAPNSWSVDSAGGAAPCAVL